MQKTEFSSLTESNKKVTHPIKAKYRFETTGPLDVAVNALAGEQSYGTFVKTPGESEELRSRFGASVDSVTEIEVDASGKARRWEIVLSFPFENVGPSLPNLVTTVAGNFFELREVTGLRLLDVDVPIEFSDQYPGPQFGIEGTRKLSGVYDSPLIGTIIKPSVGLSPEQTSAMVKTLVESGVDFIKDDELIANPSYSPLKKRVEAVMEVINNHAERTGKKVMYGFNITDEIDTMLRHHDTVLDAGGTCVMVSLLSVGLGAVSKLRRYSQLPIHGHRNGWGAISRSPNMGISFTAYQKFWRIAGVDHLHVNGLRSKFYESDDSVITSACACLESFWGGYTVMPVFSSAQWASHAPDTYHALGGRLDLMHLAGGGILGHPGGAAAGVASIRQGWAAAVKGIPLDDYSREHKELRQALEFFGKL